MNIFEQEIGRRKLLVRSSLIAVALINKNIVRMNREQAKTADAFVDSIGISPNQGYDPLPHNYETIIKPRLIELGVRHIRASIAWTSPRNNPNYPVLETIRTLHSQHKIKTTFFWAGFLKISDFQQVCSYVRDALEAVEGPNEPDLDKYAFQYEGNGWVDRKPIGKGWIVGLKNCQKDIYNTVKKDPDLKHLPVIQTSMGWGHNSNDLVRDIGNLEKYCDYGNFHFYNLLHQPPEEGINSWHIYYARKITPTKSLMCTEAGPHPTKGIDGKGHLDETLARYIPRLFLESWRNGIVRTFKFRLEDNYDGNWGLIRSDGSRKPAFFVIKNIISLLQDPGEDFPTNSLSFNLISKQSIENIQHVLLQKRNRNFYLIVWQGVSSATESGKPISIAARLVKLNLAKTFLKINIYLPLNSLNVVNSYKNTKSISILVPDHPLILELVPYANQD